MFRRATTRNGSELWFLELSSESENKVDYITSTDGCTTVPLFTTSTIALVNYEMKDYCFSDGDYMGSTSFNYSMHLALYYLLEWRAQFVNSETKSADTERRLNLEGVCETRAHFPARPLEWSVLSPLWLKVKTRNPVTTVTATFAW